MKPSLPIICAIPSLLLAWSANLIAASPALRYCPAPEQTNVYSVQISLRSENGTDTLSGNLIATAKPNTNGSFSLGLQGMLIPKRELPPRPMMGMPPSYPRMTAPIRLAETELQFDARGRLLKSTGDAALPFPLGTLGQLLVEPLPGKPSSRWENGAELCIVGEPLNLGPANGFLSSSGTYPTYGYYSSFPGTRGGPSIINVTRLNKYAVTTSKPGSITVSKTTTIESPLLTGKEPQVLATGKGQFEIAPDTGLLLAASFESTGAVNSETVTRRNASTMTIKLLTGAERENVLNPPAQIASEPAKPLSADELAQTFKDLQSDDGGKRSAAIIKLQSSTVENPPAELIKYLSDRINDTDSLMRDLAVKFVADNGTSEDAPTLIRLLKSDDYSARQSAMRGLVRLQEKSAAEPLAELLALGDSDSSSAADALIKLGPAAEDAVLPLLKERHADTLRNACRVLKQIGTQKSLEPLKDLVLSPSASVNQAAAEAARAVAARTTE